jgi:adenylate cyclase
MKDAKLLLVDTDDYSASVLLEDLRQHGFGDVPRAGRALALPTMVARDRPDLVVFNHHFDRPDDLLGCCNVKLASPDTLVVALAAAGPSVRKVREWAAETSSIDAVLQKPLEDGGLATLVRSLLEARRTRHELQARNARLERLLPEGALAAVGAGHGQQQEELFEAAVLFTDVRRSSDVITRLPPREFFGLLNRTLSAQARVVRRFEGQVLKYTGDGLIAVFRGMGRTYLAMRCAVELAAGSSEASLLPYGLGVAEGLVLGGLVGSDDGASSQQYDVIGATVHLASRLCALASPGEVVATGAAHTAARLRGHGERAMPAVEVRGFPHPVDCVALRPASVETAALPE